MPGNDSDRRHAQNSSGARALDDSCAARLQQLFHFADRQRAVKSDMQDIGSHDGSIRDSPIHRR